MKKHRQNTVLSTVGSAIGLATFATATSVWAAPATSMMPARMTVDFSQPGRAISPTMHGLFFEDINYGADGGLYAELVQNRSFEHREAMYAWAMREAGEKAMPGGMKEVEILSTSPLNARNTHYLRLHAPQNGGEASISNDGYGSSTPDGHGSIAVKAGESYRFSLYARGTARGLRAHLEDASGRVIGTWSPTVEAGKPVLGATWRKYEGAMRVSATTAQGRLVVSAKGPGYADLDMVSLFPVKTFNGRRNGLRADLVQTLADMKPGFLRFPGGCVVEGKELSNAYRWKDTIGDVAQRPQNWNRWMDWEAPQYYQSYGLGFFEYFQLCEDIGAQPLPVVNCGMACQFQSGQVCSLEDLGPYVQDALDLIEFANGPANSTWGAKRAAMGHPAPFNMRYISVGNEQWGEGYFERYKIFHDAIAAKYPNIKVVSTSGPGVDDASWKLAWNKFNSGQVPATLVDEHYYRPPQWFLTNATRYDNYDRNAPKVFAGEFAGHTEGLRNNLEGAIAEAAFMTGLVRNGDVVQMASYAPLLAKVGSTQWTPDLIWFDNQKVYGSPSYYVQQMFSTNRPDMAWPVSIQAQSLPPVTYAGKAGVGTWNTQAEFKDIRIARGGQTLLAPTNLDALKNQPSTEGQWNVVDGALRQTSEGQATRVVFGEPGWGDYTLSLKARKLGGKEGFLIMFQMPNDKSRVWWNIGGWDNTRHGLELPGASVPPVNGSIETGRWYDIRVELQGQTVKCYLDNQLVQSATRVTPPRLFAVAGRDNRTGETLLQIVNAANQPLTTTLDLRGLKVQNRPVRALSGRALVLTSGSALDENSFATPRKVAPRESLVPRTAPTFSRTLPANSLTVLRLKAQG